MTAESKVLKLVGGVQQYRWDNKGRRNEAGDCFVYSLAALRISQQRFGLDLNALVVAPESGGDTAATEQPRERARKKSDFWNR